MLNIRVVYLVFFWLYFTSDNDLLWVAQILPKEEAQVNKTPTIDFLCKGEGHACRFNVLVPLT